MQYHQSAKIGDRVGFIDGDEISLGTIRNVSNDASRVRMTWDDGFEDTEDDGWWDWPQNDLKRIR